MKPGPLFRSAFIIAAAVLGAVLSLSPAEAGPTLSEVRSAGVIQCGIGEEMAGFSYKDKAGRWQGLSVDFCRAVSLAVLGSAEKVAFKPLTPAGRFPVLLSGTIDLLAHTTTMTFGREAGIGVEFAGIYYYDGQSFMVPKKSKVKGLRNLKGATVCVEKATTHQPNLENYSTARGLGSKPLVFDSFAEVTRAFFAGKCQALTADRSALAGARMAAPGGSERYDILQETISKEPLGPVVRRGDEEWLTLVRWVLFALIEAEERGVTRANVRALQKSAKDPGLSRFLGSGQTAGKSLGLKADWAVDVIAAVGNYGEIYERHFGRQSFLKIDRGQNRLWNKGGLLYAPPFQ